MEGLSTHEPTRGSAMQSIVAGWEVKTDLIFKFGEIALAWSKWGQVTNTLGAAASISHACLLQATAPERDLMCSS